MLAKTVRLLQQKKQTGATFLAQSGKTGNEEKWAQAAMEYIYEKVLPNDSRKRQADVDQERVMAKAFDRYCEKNEAVYHARLERLTQRAIEALEAIPAELLDEALLLNSAQPPLNFLRPALTPPIPGFEPGYGIDVPQLRTEYQEFPKIVRPTDHIEFGEAAEQQFPFVDPNSMLTFATKYEEKLENWHGAIRKDAIQSGPEGEQWEAYVALNKKAAARQKLILQLSMDLEFKEKYENDEEFRMAELALRGITPLVAEGPSDDSVLNVPREDPRQEEEIHYAQQPKYQPFRKV